MKKQNKLVGKIILADFLEYTVEKFLSFVSIVEGSPLYNKLAQEGIIVFKPLSGASMLREANVAVLAKAGVIGKVAGGTNSSICYSAREFSIEYQVRDEKLSNFLDNQKLSEEERKNINHLLNKLRRINTRNVIVHKILKGIVEYQKDYFTSNNESDLKPLTRVELARFISDFKDGKHDLDFMLDTSRISRAIRGLSLIAPSGEELPLWLLFPSRRDMVKRYIKAILNQEKKDIGSGHIAKPYTDEEIGRKINERYGLLVVRREIGYCRKELGILPYSVRNGYVYHTLAANFSPIYPFTILSIEHNTPAGSGIYELCLAGDAIGYPTGLCQTFYIGSAKNLRRRLRSHFSSGSKNGGIKRFIAERDCVFRYLRVPRIWTQEERRFHKLFISAYGDPPLCNHTSPKRPGIPNLRV